MNFKMKAIKQYRLKLTITKHFEGSYSKTISSKFKEFSNINEVNECIDKLISIDAVAEDDILIESYDWQELEFLPLCFGKIKNKLKS